ncbi:MAG: divalent-cation tolerance protein CutA [Candidatus Nitrotoga sp.]
MVLTNLPDRASAEGIAQMLITEHLAACVNILAECSSVYRWQGKIETANEVPVLIKTTRAAYPRVAEMILAHHPYELPEVIAVPIDLGLPVYLEWVQQALKPTSA